MDETLPPSKPNYAGAPEPTSPRQLADTTPTAIGPYRVVEKLGTGSMGIVYRCHDPKLRRDVAVKVLRKRYSDDEHYRQRFQREAKAIASLSHPCVVSIHSIGEEITDSQHITYIVMELVEGHSADTLLHVEGAIPLARAACWVRDAATGLRAAAAKDLIHRDVKPSNLLLTDTGEVKIVDFGLAKDLTADNTLTEDGIVLGTPHYISPEQGRGQRVDHRSDIYSLGATFYHLITGHPPFERDSQVSVIVAHVSETPRPPHETQHDLPVAATQVAFHMMAKSADNRYSDYDTLIEDLDALVAGTLPPHAGTLSTGKAFSMTPPLPIWRRPRWVAALAFVLLLTGLGWALAITDPNTTAADEELKRFLGDWYSYNRSSGISRLDLNFTARAGRSTDDLRRQLFAIADSGELPVDSEQRPEIRGSALSWANFQRPFAVARTFRRLQEARLSVGDSNGSYHLRLSLVSPDGAQVRSLAIRLAIPETPQRVPLVQAQRAHAEIPVEEIRRSRQRIPRLGRRPFEVVVDLAPVGEGGADTRVDLSFLRSEQRFFKVSYRIPGSDWSNGVPVFESQSIHGRYALSLSRIQLKGELAHPISVKEAPTWRS